MKRWERFWEYAAKSSILNKERHMPTLAHRRKLFVINWLLRRAKKQGSFRYLP